MNYEKAGSFWDEKDAGMKPMPEQELWQELENFAKGHKTCVLGTACESFVRCTPLSYRYVDGQFFIFSEGGRKFLALEKNKNVGLSINNAYKGPGSACCLQVEGAAEAYGPDDEEYASVLARLGMKLERMLRMPTPLYLIIVRPSDMIYLNSKLREKGYGVRQHISLHS